MSYKIITDSSCDFTADQYQEQGLIYVPLNLHCDSETKPSFTEPADLHRFYDGIRGGDMPTTSAVNPEGWAAVMKPVLEQGEDVLCLAFSSGLSTTYQSAVIAADDLREEFPDRKICVVDTLSASLGQGLLVWHTCRKRDAGMSLEELTAWVEDARFHLCHWFTVDDLMYLKRGGRVSAVTASVGSLLKIKPVMHMDDAGHLINVSKVRGRKASIEALAKKMEETALPGENDTVFICHGDCPEDARYLEQLVRKLPGVNHVMIGYTGAVIGSHSGPGTLALFYLGTHR